MACKRLFVFFKVALSITFSVFFITCLSFSSAEKMSRYYFTGIMGNTLVMQMDITINGNNITGRYYYEFSDTVFTVAGTFTGRKAFKADVFDENKIKTGSIDIEFTESWSHLNGCWKSCNSKKSLDISLKKVADYHSFHEKLEEVESTVVFPQFSTDKEVLKSLNKTFINASFNEHQWFIKDAIDNYYSDEYFHPWHQVHELTIEYYSQHIISLISTVYMYSGGAHGNTGYIVENYVVEKGKVIPFALKDIFLPETPYVKMLSKYILNDLHVQKAGWVIEGMVTDIDENTLSSFTVNRYGIRFAFAPYIMGCYAEGSYFVTVPYRVVRNIIDSKGPLEEIVADY